MSKHGHDIIDEGVELVRRLRELHVQISQHVIAARQLVERQALPLPQLVDLAWVLGDIEKHADDARKDAVVLGTTVEKTACGVWAAMMAADPETPDHVEGLLARGTPKDGRGANVPERGTREHTQLMEFLGVPEGSRDALSVKWTRLCDMIDARAAEGLPPPPGIPANRTYARFTLTNVKLKKGVNID